MPMRTEVNASAATELASGPPSTPRVPAAFASSITVARASRSSPNTSTSQSTLPSAASLAALTLWKADWTRTASASSRCALKAADPSGGRFTTDTFGGTSGTTASTTILPVTTGLISLRMASWLS
jgi:hypothetical protein